VSLGVSFLQFSEIKFFWLFLFLKEKIGREITSEVQKYPNFFVRKKIKRVAKKSLDRLLNNLTGNDG
jgi:phage terminase Nu1 subunit (DNA packaging protein)